MIASSLTYAIIFASMALLAAAFSIVALSRHRKAASGDFDLIGAVALVETTLEPEGAVIVRGELWRARCSHMGAKVLRGERVRVVGASEHLLQVEQTL